MLRRREWCPSLSGSFFFLNDTATSEIYTLSLRDALPIFDADVARPEEADLLDIPTGASVLRIRSEEHTSELKSHVNLVGRLLLEKKKTDHIENLDHLLDRATTVQTPLALHGCLL